MIVEPHTFDPEPEQEPDCAVACADALLQIAEFLAKASHQSKSAIIRIAAIQVVLGRMTAAEAAVCYKITRPSIYNQTKILARSLGLYYVRGKIQTRPPR